MNITSNIQQLKCCGVYQGSDNMERNRQLKLVKYLIDIEMSDEHDKSEENKKIKTFRESLDELDAEWEE